MASYKTLVTNYMKARTKEDLARCLTAIQQKLRAEVGEFCDVVASAETIIKAFKGNVRVLQ